MATIPDTCMRHSVKLNSLVGSQPSTDESVIEEKRKQEEATYELSKTEKKTHSPKRQNNFETN